jgi:murein L,D-transpeptidase YcbB/YkuD
MSAFGRGRRRLAVAGAVAAALAVGLGSAGATAAEADRGRGTPLVSPESPIRFGANGGVSPLIATFNAARVGREDALTVGLVAWPRLDLFGFAATTAEAGPAPAKARAAPETGFAAAPAFAPAPSPQANAAPAAEPPPAPPLTPVQAALQSATERLVAEADQRNPLGAGDWSAARAAIAFFYAARDFEPVWAGADGLTPAGRAALAQLGRGRDDGLSLVVPRAIGAALAPDALAEAEIAIASAVVIYAEQATGSRVPPTRVSPFIFATRSVADPGAALRETTEAPDPARRLADFNPPQKGYRDLREEWMRLIAPPPSASGPTTDLPTDPQPDKAGRAGKRPAGGRIHTASADPALAFGALARKRAAILANMEMWRWEPRDMGERRIEVNIPDFSVKVMEGDAAIHEARVIVGKPETPTPIFSSPMRYVILNPSWLVPDSIIRKEFASKLGALSRRGYEVKTVGGRLTVRQLPGDDNALGRIAFMFPNDHSVYMHDTPARELFDEDVRAFSHGCIRVEDPPSLAEIVLGGNGSKWTAERIDAAIGGPERTVFLPNPLPVHIEYFTEFVDGFGEIKERPDIYGLIRRVEGILGQASQD